MSDYVGPAAVAATVRADAPAGGAWVHDDSRNPWRYKLGQPDVIEIHFISNDVEFVTMIDAVHHKYVKGFCWCGKKSGRTMYAHAWNGSKRMIMLHRLLNPHLPNCDHINRDGLDNRDSNIRDGTGSVNTQNVKAKMKNVWTNDKRCEHVAQWYDANGQKKAKYFSWKRDDETSKTARRAEAEVFVEKEKANVMEDLIAKQPKRVRDLEAIPKPPPVLRVTKKRRKRKDVERGE